MARREGKKGSRAKGIAKSLDAIDARFERAREVLGAEPKRQDLTEIEQEQVLAALKKAMRWLAQRDRSEGEVRERLVKADFDTDVIARVINVLRKMGAINDERHAAGVVERAMREIPAGDALIAHALERQKADKDAAARAMEGLKDERSRLKVAAASVVAKLPASLPSAAKWRRAMGSLLRRGFEEDAAREALEGLLGALDDGPLGDDERTNGERQSGRARDIDEF